MTDARAAAKRLWVDSHAAFKARDYQRAAELLQALLQEHGEPPEPAAAAQIRVSLGVTLLRLKRTEEGVAELRRAVELRPDVARAWHKLGAGLGRLRHHEEALPCFQRATALEPDVADYQWRLGEQLRRLGRREEALAALHRCLELDPGNTDALRSLNAIAAPTTAP